MFYYGYAQNLHSGILQFVEKILPLLEYPSDKLLLRHMASTDFEKKFRLYLQQFSRSFGSIPRGNEIYLENLRE